MNILCIGDIVGKPGRRAVSSILRDVKKQYLVDLVIANGENLSHGRGISLTHYEAMREAGVDWLTSGNHIWARPDIFPYLSEAATQITRPANYGPKAPGRGVASFAVSGRQVHLINLMGRVFMPEGTENPFLCFDTITKGLTGIIIVDLHAEATSEKWAFSQYVAGRAAIVVGTHTHVPTADARILEGGTAFITDIGMTGSIDSIIGAKKPQIIDHFLTGLPWKYEVADEGPTWFNALLVKLNDETGTAEDVELIQRVLPAEKLVP